MKIFFLLSAIIFAGVQMITAQKINPEGFNIYLLPKIKPDRLSTINIKNLKPYGKPLISQNEILYYQKETHEFQIDYIAAERIKKINDSGSSSIFVVFLGEKAVYVGAFWKSIFSKSFDGIIIDTFKALGKSPYYSNSDFPVLKFELGFPSSEYFKGIDHRNDAEIFSALENAGVLYDELELTVKCKNIIATGKRRPSSIFTFDVISVNKGKFDEKEITLELFDRKLLSELEADLGFQTAGDLNFNKEIEIILTYLKQMGKPEPNMFFKTFRKK